MPTPEYYGANIPIGMKNEIERIIKTYPELGFVNPNQFVVDAVRRRIVEFKSKG